MHRLGHGHERTYDTKPYEYGDPFQLDLQRTIRNALGRRGRGVVGTPVELEPDDFEIERTEHLTRSSTVLMLDLSLSMPMRDNFLPAKKVAMALHSLISTQFPRDYLGLVGFSETARILTAEQLPEVSWDFVYGTNMQHGFTLARQLLARQSGTKQIIMITDGEPTAHVTPSGDVFFNYPPVTETVEATLREVLRCTREGIRINTFMLDATSYLTAFVERLTEINRGRAFFTTPETLGDYVLVDFIEHKRSQARSRRAGCRARQRSARSARQPRLSISRDPPLRVRDVVCDNHSDVITTLSSVRNRGHGTTRQGVLHHVRLVRIDVRPGRPRLAGRSQLPRRRSRPLLPRAGRLDTRGEGGVPGLRRPRGVPRVRPAERREVRHLGWPLRA